MAKKLSLDDLKVQSFVTTLNPEQADQMVGGTQAETNCPCTKTHACGCTNASNCCDTIANCTGDPNCTGTADTGADCCQGTALNCGTYDPGSGMCCTLFSDCCTDNVSTQCC